MLASAALAAGLAWWRAETNVRFEPHGPLQRADAAWVFILNPISFGVVIASLVLWLIACVTVVTSFFHDRNLTEQQQKRAIALSCYTCATIAWLPLGIPLGAFIISIAGESPAYATPMPVFIGNAILVFCWLAFVVQAFAWLRSRYRPPGQTPGQTRGQNYRRLTIALFTGAVMSAGYALVWRQWENWGMSPRFFGSTVSTGSTPTCFRYC